MTPIILRSPSEFLTALPYQLGYQPSQSLVAVGLKAGGIALIERVSTPSPHVVRACADDLVRPLMRAAPDRVLLIGYEDVRGECLASLRALSRAVERAGLAVAEVIVVRNGRRYSPFGHDPGCPPEGIPLLEASQVPAVAAYVARERSPLPSREALLARVEPSGEAAQVRLGGTQGSSGSVPSTRVLAAWGEVIDPQSGELGPERIAELAADLVTDLPHLAWRDALIAWLAPRMIPVSELNARIVRLIEGHLPRTASCGWPMRATESSGPASGAPRSLALVPPLPAPGREPTGFGPDVEADIARRRLLDRLVMLCRALPDDAGHPTAACCSIAASVAWHDGEGTLARAAVDRAQRVDPDYPLAVLLGGLIDHGVRFPTVPVRSHAPTAVPTGRNGGRSVDARRYHRGRS